jgi:hypothetical protein
MKISISGSYRKFHLKALTAVMLLWKKYGKLTQNLVDKSSISNVNFNGE